MSFKKIFTILLVCACSACGGDHHWGDSDGKRRVKEVYITEDAIEVGDETRVDVYFETKSNDFGEPKDIQVVVRIPSTLLYKYDSSKLHIGDLSKKSREPDNIVECEDDTTYLLYNLDDDDDLKNTWADRYDLSFYAIGTERAELAVIFAQGDEYIDFSCSTEFEAQEQDSVMIE